MGLIDLFRKSMFVKVILTLWLVCSVILVFLLNRIDSIVNGNLYKFGLQFSVAWADPYWTALHLIYIFLAVPAIFSVVVLIAGFGKTNDGAVRVNKQVTSKVSTGQTQPTKENSMLIRCVKCGKLFSKPGTILDFSNGKPQLANVCPYCNHVLGKTDDVHPNEKVRAEFEEEVQPE